MGFFEKTAQKLLTALTALRAEPVRPETVSWHPTGQTFGEYWDALSETGRHEFLLRSAIRAHADHDTDDPWPRPDPEGLVVLAVHDGIRVNIELGDLKALRDMAGQRSNIGTDPFEAATRNRPTSLTEQGRSVPKVSETVCPRRWPHFVAAMTLSVVSALPDYRVHHVLASAAAPLEHVLDGA